MKKPAKKNYFCIDFAKFDEYAKKKNHFTDSELSVRLGHHRGWLYQVRKRFPHRIKLNDALELENQLGHNMQDFEMEGYESFHSFPIDQDAKARDFFDILLEKYPKILAEVLEYMFNNEHDLSDLRLYISTYRAPVRRKKMDNEWPKMLYASELARAIVDHWDYNFEYEYLLDEFSKDKKRKIVQPGRARDHDLDKARAIVSSAAAKKVRTILEDQTVEDDAVDECAKFLCRAFKAGIGGFEKNFRVARYRKGELY